MKKNKILKLLIWALYAVTAGGCFLTVMAVLASRQGYGGNIALAAAGVLVVLAGVTFFVLQGLLGGRRREENGRKKIAAAVVESLAFLLCLIGMLAVRLPVLQQVEPNVWSTAAEVAAGQSISFVGHGGADAFLWLLHGVFFVFGNKLMAAAVLQIVLQAVAAFFVYDTVRRLSGSVSALIALGFFCFSPYLSREMMALSPLPLFLAVTGLTIWLTAGIWTRWNARRDSRGVVPALLLYLLIGMLTGFCCWLDAAGVSVPVFLLWVTLFYRDPGDEESGRKPVGFWNQKAFIAVFCLVTGALSYLGIHALVVFVDGRNFQQVLLADAQKFIPGIFRIPTDVYGREPAWDIQLMVCLLVIGIFSFFRGCMHRSCGVWLAAAVVLLGMQCFGIAGREPVNSFALLYLFCAAVAGNALGVIFRGSAFRGKKTEQIPEEPEQLEQPEQFEPGGEPAEMPVPEEPELAEEPQADPEIQYIENPLPLPKKSKKKFMDFDHEVADDDDFDFF